VENFGEGVRGAEGKKGEVLRATENRSGGLAILSSTLRLDQATPSPTPPQPLSNPPWESCSDLKERKRRTRHVVESHVGAQEKRRASPEP
jgi:hypothetical protein